MKSFGTTLAFAGAASAAAIQARAAPEAQCCFGINVNGAVAGSVGQLGDGQNRVGSGFGGAQFCYYPDTTSIVDASGRGCIATSPTTQYQCDAGLTATTATSGITLASNGSIEHGGSAVWYECDSGNGFNIYQVSPGAAGTKCSQITLTVAGGNCSAPASSSSASSTKPASSSSASVSSASASKASSSSASASSVSASKSSSSVVSTSIATSTVVSTSTKPASTSTASVASPTTLTSATTQKTTQTVATPTTLTSAITQKTTQTVASPTTITPPVSVSTQVSVESCVPSTITAQASTVTVTVTAPAAPPATVTVQPSCAPCASGPAPSGPAPSGPVSSAPGPSVPAPTGPVPAQSTTYACNPAHSYPNGASCISTAGSLTLVTPSATTSAPAETYACNPAHSYPNGASCISTAGTLSLVTPSSAPASTRNSVSTATLTSTIQSTATIPASSAQGSTTAPASSPASGTPSNMSPGSTKAAPPAPAATVCTKPNVNGQYGCPEQCPLDLSTGPFEYPHLIQINGQNGYFGEVNATAKTDFTFDIPASLAGKTCNAYFAIPTKSQLVTADYSLSTAQGAQVYLSSGGKQVSAFSPVAGQNVLVSSGPCAAGKAVTYEMTADNSIDFRWFQDYNACALGLFVVPS